MSDSDTTGQPFEACWDDVIGDRERRLLAEKSAVPVPSDRVALIMVDLFAQVFTPESDPMSCEPFASATVPVLQRLVQAARGAGIPVVHTTGEDRGAARPRSATLMMGGRESSAAGRQAGYRIIEELAPQPQEHVVYKSGASAFFGTSMVSILRRLDVATLVVCGESTSGCVRATVVDAYSHGFDVIVPQEAVFDRSSLSHKINLFDMHLKYATVIPVDQVLHGWRPLARP